MVVAAGALFAFESTFADALGELCVPWEAAPVPEPRVLALNESLALELGVDPAALQRPHGVAELLGQVVSPGSRPVAQAYAGHQFGGYSPRLGDGRALLLGEVIGTAGQRRDIHLKGSGRTPFSRGGDGKAAVGPMLREHLMGEAMHALGIPTTRALAVVATGEQVQRDAPLPGAVLVRVAASHLRVGTFQYAADLTDDAVLRRLADYAIGRHHPSAAGASNRYLALFECVVDAQASLVAKWMSVGFVHGVMNTDNMTISGETIDYGPCAFMDAFDPDTVFSSIDQGGRYAFGNQPAIAQWNLARLGETLLALIDTDDDRAVALATEVLASFPDRYRRHWEAGMRAKLGLPTGSRDDAGLFDSLVSVLQRQRVDATSFFRALAASLRGDDAALLASAPDPSEIANWAAGWRAALARGGVSDLDAATAMDRVNPAYVPRNHLVEEALAAATEGSLEQFARLVDIVTTPFDVRPERAGFESPAPPSFGAYRTFCGT